MAAEEEGEEEEEEDLAAETPSLEMRCTLCGGLLIESMEDRLSSSAVVTFLFPFPLVVTCAELKAVATTSAVCDRVCMRGRLRRLSATNVSNRRFVPSWKSSDSSSIVKAVVSRASVEVVHKVPPS